MPRWNHPLLPLLMFSALVKELTELMEVKCTRTWSQLLEVWRLKGIGLGKDWDNRRVGEREKCKLNVRLVELLILSEWKLILKSWLRRIEDWWVEKRWWLSGEVEDASRLPWVTSDIWIKREWSQDYNVSESEGEGWGWRIERRRWKLQSGSEEDASEVEMSLTIRL